MPTATGIPDATIALVQGIPLSWHPKCIEPALPPNSPDFFANNSSVINWGFSVNERAIAWLL